MSRLIEYLITGRLTEESFEREVVFPNNMNRPFLSNIHYFFKPKKIENNKNIWYEFQLTDEFGDSLYGCCYSSLLENGNYFVICLLSSLPKSYTFRTILNEIHLDFELSNNVYPLLAEFCRLIIPDTFTAQVQLPISGTNINLNIENDCHSHYVCHYLSPTLISIILHDILTEKSVLFISSSYTKLVHCASSLQIMIQPLRYSGVIVPLVPYSMVHTIEAPTYYLMGCHRSCLTSSINFQQSDLVVDLDTLEIINDNSKDRSASEIEIYARKVAKVVGGFTCYSDYLPHLLHATEQEKEFRLLWKSWVINLCSSALNDRKNNFNELFSKTTMCEQFILDEQSVLASRVVKIAFDYNTKPKSVNQFAGIDQEQFMELLDQSTNVQLATIRPDKNDVEYPFYLILCNHIWTFYDEYNPVLDLIDCEETLLSLLESKMDANTISIKIEEIMNHLSDADKSKIELWDLPEQLKLKFYNYTKRRSTQILKKSLNTQASSASVVNNNSILGEVSRALQFDQNITTISSDSLQKSALQLNKQKSHASVYKLNDCMILNEMLLSSDLPLIEIPQDMLVRCSCNLLNLLITAYSESSSLMYRSEKKEPVAKFISDRKKMLSIKRSAAYSDFLDLLKTYSLYNLDSLRNDNDKLCFWMNTRHTLYEVPESKLKASSNVAYQLGRHTFSLLDMIEGLCRPGAVVRFYTKSNVVWHGLKPEILKYAALEYPQEINFILSDYTGSSCRIQPYYTAELESQVTEELNNLVENEFKIDLKKKRILMPLCWSWLYKEFGDHPNDMIINICEMLPNNHFTLTLFKNDAIRCENGRPSRISRKWNIKFFKETIFCVKFKLQ